MSESPDKPDIVTRAFDEYVASFRGGHGDPAPFLDRFEGRQRKSLALMIEAFVETGPRSNPDPADPRFEKIFDRVLAQVDAPSGGLAEFLAKARQKARKTQAAVVSALARSLGATPREEDKIDRYYHQLEWGSLPASGLSDSLYEMLGKILEVEPRSLKDAAASPGSRYGAASGPVFARSFEQIELKDDGSVAPGSAGSEFAEQAAEESSDRPDRIDELFTGG